jgi:hypothetical protein
MKLIEPFWIEVEVDGFIGVWIDLGNGHLFETMGEWFYWTTAS